MKVFKLGFMHVDSWRITASLMYILPLLTAHFHFLSLQTHVGMLCYSAFSVLYLSCNLHHRHLNSINICNGFSSYNLHTASIYRNKLDMSCKESNQRAEMIMNILNPVPPEYSGCHSSCGNRPKACTWVVCHD